MTMRELMTHTAGSATPSIGNNPVDKTSIGSKRARPRRAAPGNDRQAREDSAAAQPGTRWLYSLSVDVQGYLVEQLSGQPFDEFARTRIFEPLGMTDTAFYVPRDKVGRMAIVHSEDTNGGPLTANDGGRDDPTVKPAGPSGGGGLYIDGR